MEEAEACSEQKEGEGEEEEEEDEEGAEEEEEEEKVEEDKRRAPRAPAAGARCRRGLIAPLLHLASSAKVALQRPPRDRGQRRARGVVSSARPNPIPRRARQAARYAPHGSASSRGVGPTPYSTWWGRSAGSRAAAKLAAVAQRRPLGDARAAWRFVPALFLAPPCLGVASMCRPPLLPPQAWPRLPSQGASQGREMGVSGERPTPWLTLGPHSAVAHAGHFVQTRGRHSGHATKTQTRGAYRARPRGRHSGHALEARTLGAHSWPTCWPEPARTLAASFNGRRRVGWTQCFIEVPPWRGGFVGKGRPRSVYPERLAGVRARRPCPESVPRARARSVCPECTRSGWEP